MGEAYTKNSTYSIGTSVLRSNQKIMAEGPVGMQFWWPWPMAEVNEEFAFRQRSSVVFCVLLNEFRLMLPPGKIRSMRKLIFVDCEFLVMAVPALQVKTVDAQTKERGSR